MKLLSLSSLAFVVAQLVALPALAQQGTPATPVTKDPALQENGDWERHPFAVHIPIGLGWAAPFGSLNGQPNAALSDNAGTFTNFEFGVGVRVHRFLVDGLMFSIGGAGKQNGAMTQALEASGAEAHGPLRIFFGSDFAYYFERPQHWAPWIGARLGYEALMFGGSVGERGHLSYAFGGIYAAARGGIDWRISPGFGMGPVFELGWGHFFSGTATASVDDDPITLDNEAQSASTDLDMKGGANHGYVGLGVRIVFFP